jgi:Fe-S cluster biogenesis protein NfuA/nitrite reductase/ring-hydroxylating ferredoxin subunit
MATSGTDLRTVGDRVDGLLTELRALTDASVTARVEEVVRLLVELYGGALERVLEVVAEQPGGLDTIDRLAEDELVASLMILHGLHPLGVEERVHRALEGVRPYLGSHAGGVDFLGVDDAGVAHLRLQGSCDGCASSTVTVKLAIEKAINKAAPELTGIDVEGVAEPGPALLQIKPLHRAETLPETPPEPMPDWVGLTGVSGLADGELTVVRVQGVQVLVCASGGRLYAYRDACAACGSGLASGALAGERLACPGCGVEFDVRLAGRSRTSPGLHLDPLPLLDDGGTVRVALPARVAS